MYNAKLGNGFYLACMMHVQAELFIIEVFFVNI